MAKKKYMPEKDSWVRDYAGTNKKVDSYIKSQGGNEWDIAGFKRFMDYHTANQKLMDQANAKAVDSFNTSFAKNQQKLMALEEQAKKNQQKRKERQQQLKKFNSFNDKYIFGPQEWLYKHTLAPVEKGVERFVTNMADQLTPGGLKKHLNDGGKALGLEAPKFVQEAASKPKTTADKALDISGNLAGQAAPLMLGYGASSKLLNPVLSKLPQAGKIGMASKLLDSSIRGAAGMGTYGLMKEGADAALHPNDATLKERAKNVGMDMAYGAIGDPLFRIGGMATKKGFEMAANKTMKSLVPTNEHLAESISSNVSKADKVNLKLNRPVPSADVPKNLVSNPNFKPLSLKSVFGELGPNGEVLPKAVQQTKNQVATTAEAIKTPKPSETIKPNNPYQKDFEDAVKKQYEYLKNSMGKGVDYGTTGQGIGNFREVNGSFSVSRNPKWYQDFYKTNGRKPTNSELKQLAGEHVLRGFQDEFGNIPAWQPKQLQEINNQIQEVSAKIKENPEQEQILRPILDALKEDKASVKKESDQLLTKLNLQFFGEETPQVFNDLPDTRTHIGTKTQKEHIGVKATADKAYTKTVDNLHRLSQFDNQVERVLGRKLKASESTHVLGLNSRGSDMISKQILTQNMVDKTGNVVGKSLKEITMKVPKGKLKDFEDYLINQHAITRMERGEKVFPDEMQMTPEKSKAIVKKYQTEHPEFKELARDYYQYNKQLGQKWLVDTGILTKDQWKAYLRENPYYVPNNRIFSELERPKIGNTAKKGFANQTNPVKKAVGSQRKIVSPIESTIEHTATYVKTAKRNEVMQTLINNIKQNPEAFKDWAEIVPTEKTPQDIMESLKQEGVEGLLENINKGFDQKPDLTKGNIIRGLIDGNPVHVRVHDPALLDALTNLQPKAQQTVIHWIGQATRVMKNLTTGINPVFSLTRNIFRDIPTAYVNSHSTNNPFIFSKDLLQSIVSVMKNDEVYRSFKAVGGGHASPVSSDVNLLAQSKRSILPQKGVKPLLSKGLGALENLNNAVEAAPRLAEFKRLSGNDYDSKMKALFEANDVTVNFNKYGNTSKEVDALIPYFNAAVQGLDKTYRTFLSPSVPASQKIAAGVKAFVGITIPTILMYQVNHNDPNYQKVSNYVKDTNILIPKGDGTFYKIPKPRELGVVFGTDVERVLRRWQDQDPNAFKDFGTYIMGMFAPPIRTIAAPIFDIRANKNFMDAPIVPGDLQGLTPKYQYDSQTSEVSKKVGDVLNVSPKQIDYLLKSYGGVLGELGIPATTKNTTIGQTLKQKVTVDPVFSNDIQRDFYNTKTKLDQAHADLNKQGVKGKNLNEELRKTFDKKSLEMGKIRKKIKEIQNDSKLTPSERLAKIRVLQEKINQIAASGNQLAR